MQQFYNGFYWIRFMNLDEKIYTNFISIKICVDFYFLYAFFNWRHPKHEKVNSPPPKIRKVIQNNTSHAGFWPRLLWVRCSENRNDQASWGISVWKLRANLEGKSHMFFHCFSSLAIRPLLESKSTPIFVW